MTGTTTPTQTRRMTYAEYRALPERMTKCELVHGELREEMTGANTTHQRISRRLFAQLYPFVARQKRGEIFYAPYDVHLSDDLVYQPDLLFVSVENQARIGEGEVQGPPDLVVEILPESSKRIDRQEKFINYALFGVREYWLVHPEAELIEVYVLRNDQYRLLGRYGREEKVQSEVLARLKFPAGSVFAE